MPSRAGGATPDGGAEAFIRRHGRLAVVGALVLVFAFGYGIRAIEDVGRLSAGTRAESMLRPPPDTAIPAEFSGSTVPVLAAGHYTASHAAVTGQVEQVTHELDGDIHLRIVADGAFIVAEIVPEFPLSPPHIGQQIVAWGIVRHDGFHNWWELHPLIGWMPGNALAQSSPGPGAGD